MKLYTNIILTVAYIFIGSILCATGCGKKSTVNDFNTYPEEIRQWQTNRTTQIRREDGWLSLAGLFWLKDGENIIGTDPSNTVVFPAGSTLANAGTIILHKGNLTIIAGKESKIRFQDSTVTRMKLTSDESGENQPTILVTGSLSFYAIKRGDRFGIRIKDKNNPALKNFRGLDFFPINSAWRIEAIYKPYPEPKIIEIASIIGTVNKDTCTGALTFKIGSQMFSLDVITDPGTRGLYVMFIDETAGKETYGNGRQLSTASPDEKGKVILDFNKAFNWPCAYTPYATCPIPPKQNYIPVRIEAGEKNYPGATESIY